MLEGVSLDESVVEKQQRFAVSLRKDKRQALFNAVRRRRIAEVQQHDHQSQGSDELMTSS